MEILSLSQLVKEKGGTLTARLRGFTVDMEIKFPGGDFRKIYFWDLDGLRWLEEMVEEATGVGICRSNLVSTGIDRKRMREAFPQAENYGEIIAEIGKLYPVWKESSCSHGFMKSEMGTLEDLVGGIARECYQARDDREKRAMNALLVGDEVSGRWEGLVFTRSGNFECGCMLEIAPLINWVGGAQWVAFTRGVGQITAGEIRAESFDQDPEQLFFTNYSRALTTMAASDQQRLYWAGGNPVGGKGKSIAAVIFPEGGPMLFAEFLEKAVHAAKSVWDYQQKNREMGARSVEAFVVGQMLRSKAQLVVDEIQKTVMYEPRPAQYRKAMAGIARELEDGQ